ncbi:ricin-type beta-trefoil lectin domain protein [Streptomyces sp. NPDC048277]|uniref:ricin-type beta-trefoil lectin domain protein n=1 Tax=Streptomyces sp. NPDC048277 TaxID=3155027 RepID=UPI0033CD9D3F
MKRTFRRTLQVALTTFIAAATMGVFATSAYAGDNTWITDKDGRCITITGGGNLYGARCGWGNQGQLWDRVGSQIKHAYSNQCLDSDKGPWGYGNVYWGECNGGNYQNWDYFDEDGGWVHVQDRETKLWLNWNIDSSANYTLWTAPENTRYGSTFWNFYGGE